MPSEPSLNFIAGDIAARFGSEFELDRRELANAIEAALNAERERCAKIAETRPETQFDYDHEPAPTEQQIRNGIAAVIRGKD